MSYRTRKRGGPSHWWFNQMRKAVSESAPPSAPKETPGVPVSQIALAAKLTADPKTNKYLQGEIERGDWD